MLAAVLLACGPPQGRTFNATLTDQDGNYPLAVTVRDTTNLITAVEPGIAEASGPAQPSVSLDPEDPRVLVVTWDVEGCSDETIILFWPEGDGYHLMMTHKGGPGLGGGCVGVGLSRALRVTTSAPIATELITVIR